MTYQRRLLDNNYNQLKLLSEKKVIICALGNLHYEISREKFDNDLISSSRIIFNSNIRN